MSEADTSPTGGEFPGPADQSGPGGREESSSGGSRPDILEGLTDAQRDAVAITEGPLLVLAAAGSGKTLVITRRIAHLIGRGVRPWAVLALTFTNKAAGEMRERVLHLLPEAIAGGRGLTVTTFHSFCARVLRRFPEYVGLSPDYTIYDTPDQKAAMKDAVSRLNLSSSNFQPDRLLSAVSSAKNNLIDAEAYKANADGFWERNAARCYEEYQKILRENNAVDFDDLLLYVARLLRDHDDVRTQLQNRFRYILIDEYQDTNHSQFTIAHSLAATGERNICVVGDPDQSIYAWRGADIRNILEFQKHYPDAQVIKLGENFRSTAPILAAADHLIQHNTKRQKKPLYTTREGGELPGARACIDEHDEARVIADHFQALNVDHEIPWREMAVFYRTNALSRVLEAEFLRRGIPYTIVRGTAFYQRKEVRDALAYLRLVLNPRDEVNLRRVVNTPPRGIGDTTLKRIDFHAIDKNIGLYEALLRVNEVPGLTKRAATAVERFTKMIARWHEDISRTNGDHNIEMTMAEFFTRMIKDSGLEAQYLKSRTDEDMQRLDNLNELISSATEFEEELADLVRQQSDGTASDDAADSGSNGEFDPFGFDLNAPVDGEENAADSASRAESEFNPFDDPFGPLGAISPGTHDSPHASSEPATLDEERLFDELSTDDSGPADGPLTLLAKLRAFLERIALIADSDAIDSATGSLMLMTLHAAKGLEFSAVAICGLEENLLPHTMSRHTDDEIEEERRLFFVGITRAREHLLITRAVSRTVRGMHEATIPSRFLMELPSDGIRWIGDVMTTAAHAPSDEDLGGRGVAPTMGGYEPAWKRSSSSSSSGRGAVGSAFPVGSRVVHPQFGTGRVKSSSHSGGDLKLIIQFDDVGMKTLVERFARLQRVD